MTTMQENQRKVPLLERSINGSLDGSQVLTGQTQQIASRIVVCHQCGHLGGTLEKYEVETGKYLYYHAAHAPNQLIEAKRAQKIVTGKG